MRKTKILCTLGPASSDLETIRKLLDAGMNAVRLNFSHGTHEDHAGRIAIVGEAAHEADRMIPIVADLQGPKVRTGKLQGGGPAELVTGRFLRLTTRQIPGDAETVSIGYAHLAQDVEPDDPILLSDGAIQLRVNRIDGDDVVCEIIHGGLLGERKGVNVPGAMLTLPSITEKDKADLNFALSQGADYVALSFVRRAKDVRLARNLIEAAGGRAEVIAKLEKPQALENLDEILHEADGVMVARGDLGVELNPWEVPAAQKRIIERAAVHRKPAITATQMLESMIRNPTPTRAEASDVANAVFDGSDALMLSGETAVGSYPVEAVRMMSRIIETAEANIPDAALNLGSARHAEGDAALSLEMAHSGVRLAIELGAKYIVVYTESGYTARLVSKHRPACGIVGLSRHKDVCQRIKLLRGVRAKQIEQVEDLDQLTAKVETLLLELGWVQKGDLLCLLAGTPFEMAGRTDLIKLFRAGEA